MGMLQKAAAPAADDQSAAQGPTPDATAAPAGGPDASAEGDGSATAEQAATDAGMGGESEGAADAADTGEGGEGEAGASPQAGQKATPQEQAEYDRVSTALHTMLYVNDTTSSAIFAMMHPDDKIGSTAKAALLTIHQLDQRLHLSDVIVPQITVDVVSSLIDMSEQTKKMTFDETEAKAALTTAFEGVLRIFGFSDTDAKQFVDRMNPQERQQNISDYHTLLQQAEAKSQAQPGGPSEQKVAPQSPAPQSMLSQGAAQAPQAAAPAPDESAAAPPTDQSAEPAAAPQGG